MPNEISENQFVCFDGGVKCVGELLVLDDKSLLPKAEDPGFTESQKASRGLIPRGAGLSFAAASFGEGIRSIEIKKLDRIAVLENQSMTITVDAGVSVGVLLDYLLSHGYYLNVLPGYPTITIGGCIAADVHGKHQERDGNFINQVIRFTLHHLDHGIIEVSRDTNSELFDLTAGGFGLTGTILSVTLLVKTVPSTLIDVSVRPIADLQALPQLLVETSGSIDQMVTWHDFNQTGGLCGRGFLQSATFDQCGQQVRKSIATTMPIKQSTSQSHLSDLSSEGRGVWFPSIYGRLVTGLMNAFYYHNQTLKVGSLNRLSVHEWYFPNKRSRDIYFHCFGKTGFHEYQVIIPFDGFSYFMEKVRWWLSRNDLPITMASSKLFGGSKKLLRFDGAGICFAFDFPRCITGFQFLSFLDELTIETQSLPNIHKDSRLPLKVVEGTYLEYHDFKGRLRAFDSKRRYQSELSRRLSL